MLKNELAIIHEKKKKEIELKEYKRKKILNILKNNYLAKELRYLKEKNEKRKEWKYDEQTEEIIKKLPNKLKRLAKKGVDYTDIHMYFHSVIVAPALYENMADKYIDKRGEKIIEFLTKEDIPYTLATHNYVIESYYTIRVIFKK